MKIIIERPSGESYRFVVPDGIYRFTADALAEHRDWGVWVGNALNRYYVNASGNTTQWIAKGAEGYFPCDEDRQTVIAS